MPPPDAAAPQDPIAATEPSEALITTTVTPQQIDFLLHATPSDILDAESLLGPWLFLRHALRQVKGPDATKRFRWENKGPLPLAFNSLCDAASALAAGPPFASPGGHQSPVMAHLVSNLVRLSSAMGLPISKATFAAKVKDWKNGGTRYTSGNNSSATSPSSRKRALLHFLAAESQGLSSTSSASTLPPPSRTPTLRAPSPKPLLDISAPPLTPPPHAIPTFSAPSPKPPLDIIPTREPAPSAITRPPSSPQSRIYPSSNEREHVRSCLPAKRLAFQLPNHADVIQWDRISGRLAAACASLPNDLDGARAMDNMHLALIRELCSLGLSQPAKAESCIPIRQPLPKENAVMEQIVSRASRKGRASRRQLWAAARIQGRLQQTTEDIAKARLTRKHHQMATANPKKLADEIWGRAMGSDPPDCSATECQSFFAEIFREAPSVDTFPSWLPEKRPPLPLKPLVVTAAMVAKAIRKKGTKRSAPGLDGITYALLLHLPWLPATLATIFNRIIAQQSCPEVWRYGITVLLHKGGDRSLANYRPITLTPTISKIFHTIVAAWLEQALVSTSTIPTTVQKGFLMGVSGAIEHNLSLDSALLDAKRSRKSLSMVLVDLKNAFGSVSHQRIIWALQTFGAPEWVQHYVANLYAGVHTQMHCKTWSTEFLQVHRGVLQGDTLSPLLFLLVMQVALQALQSSCPGYGYTAADNQLHFLKCFADDLTIITRKPPLLQLAIQKLEQILEWLGLQIKPSKCRTFGLSKGHYHKLNINVYNQTILNVEDAPSKFLGMQLSLEQTPREKAHIASKALLEIIQPLDDFPLPPRDKVQIYKNFAIPKMRWILLVQDVLPTALSRITSQTDQYLKKWWHLPRSTSRDALRLVTGIPSVSDIAQQSQCTKYAIAQASNDPGVSTVLARRKATGYRPLRRLLRTLGGSIPPNRKQATTKVREEQLAALKRAVAPLLVQGAWSRLDTTLRTDTQWRSIMWSLPTSDQQFASKAALDVLPTRANLLRWRVGCDSACLLCGVKETLHHVLNHCNHLLQAGAYTWRHNSILHHIAPHISAKYPAASVLVDLPGSTYRLPFHCDTAWRPDIVVLHPDCSIDFVELTCPFEPNISSAHSRKATKYAPLMDAAKQEGLVPRLQCIEMGSRGLPSPGWLKWSAAFPKGRQFTKRCSVLALQASHVIWLHRATTWPNPPLLATL